MRTALFVDAQNLMNVANYTQPLATTAGVPTQAIYRFFKMLRSYLIKFEPSLVILAWDTGRSQERLKVAPDYKANREPANEAVAAKRAEMDAQYPAILTAATLLGMYNLWALETEADDLLAAAVLAASTYESVIISGDKDFYQLIGPLVSVYSPLAKTNPRHLTAANFKEEKGLDAGQWLEYRAMMGDASDNIPGVKGCGKKTALDLLQCWGTVENFIEAVDAGTIKPKAGMRKVYEQQAGFMAAKVLMDLKVPCAKIKSPNLVSQAPDLDACRRLFQGFELAQFTDDFDAWVAPFLAARPSATAKAA